MQKSTKVKESTHLQRSDANKAARFEEVAKRGSGNSGIVIVLLQRPPSKRRGAREHCGANCAKYSEGQLRRERLAAPCYRRAIVNDLPNKRTI